MDFDFITPSLVGELIMCHCGDLPIKAPFCFGHALHLMTARERNAQKSEVYCLYTMQHHNSGTTCTMSPDLIHGMAVIEG